MSDPTIYNATAPTDGSLALAHQKIIRFKISGVFTNITGDVNNLKLNPTPITQAREVYGNKARPDSDIIGYTFAPTFDVEAVRDPVTKAVAQAWLVELLNRAYQTGADNVGEFQIFDGLDEDLPAFEGSFTIAVTEGTAGYADKAVYSFTLNSKGVVDQITSPIAGSGVPILESATPAGKTTGDVIVIRGYNLGSTVSATIDAQTVLKFVVVDDYSITILIPATVTGSAPIIVTNSVGASTSLPYTAA